MINTGTVKILQQLTHCVRRPSFDGFYRMCAGEGDSLGLCEIIESSWPI